MKRKVYPIFCLLALLASGCQEPKKQKNDEVLSERYIHKYGYDVARDDWEMSNYPGQVITTMRNGVTITSTYEDGVLHGETTHTHPHSQTLQTRDVFERGNLTHRIGYDVKGVPLQEEQFLSPTRVKITSWYKNGSPKSIETYEDRDLFAGDYYSLENEKESNIEHGFGERVTRNREGLLLTKEQVQEGQVCQRETFHSNGTPHILCSFAGGAIHGTKKIFASTGEPLSIEEHQAGRLDGLSTHFQNGVKYLEVAFRNGFKEGMEKYYVDGENLVEETEWHDGKRHGLSTVYLDHMRRKEWFYNDEKVTKLKFDELCDRERTIAIMNERAHHHAK